MNVEHVDTDITATRALERSTEICLRADSIAVAFGGVKALTDVSLRLRTGTITGLIGPNGAGKTTLINVISGLVRPTHGTMLYGADGIDLIRKPRWARAELGIARTFQHSRLFGGLTVIDQVVAGAYSRGKYGLPGALLRTRQVRSNETKLKADALELLDEVGLADLRYLNISNLPGPDQRFVDFARALASRPKLLLLDEVAAGMTEVQRTRLINLVRHRNEADAMTILVIEHDLDFIRALTESVTVMAEGTILTEGPTDEVLRRPEVLRSYIGE